MKPCTSIFFILLMLSHGLTSCGTDNAEPAPSTEQPATPGKPTPPHEQPTPDKPSNDNEENNNDNMADNKLNIRIGTSTFSVTLEDNATAKAFKALLPLTLDMAELNGNEKFYNLSTNLPTAVSRPGTIRSGDLMLFGSDCLVLFYETFSTSYGYSRLGEVDNPSGLADALGSGRATVTFEIISN